VKLTLEMGPEFRRTCRDLGAMGNAVRAAAARGLAQGGQLAAGVVVRDYLSGQSLHRRTGTLAREIASWMASDCDCVIGVPNDSPARKYAWLLGDEKKTIRPTSAKFLTIPIGENLTGAGVARYSSPREVPKGFFVRTGGKLLFGYKRGTRGKFRALFALVKSVTIQGSSALIDGVTASVDDMTAAIQTEIDGATGE